MAEIYHELTIVIKSIYSSAADPSVGLFTETIDVEEIEIWDGDFFIKNDSLEAYFLKKYQKELIQAIKEEAEEFLNDV